jgi:ATP phosphoribosyltransferase regulatory subunit
MTKSSIGLPSGWRDTLLAEARSKRATENRLAAVFEKQGYNEVSPSTVEFLELYSRTNRMVEDRAFRFLDRDDNLLALRADFTPAIARIASTRLALTGLPLRVWYCGSVFRKANLSRGESPETFQVGAELLGLHSLPGDLELLHTAMLCLSGLGIADIQLHINHAGVFRGIVEALNLSLEDLAKVKSEVHRKDARGLAATLQKVGVRDEVGQQLHALTRFVGGEDVLTQASVTLRNPESEKAIRELHQLISALEEWRSTITIDLTEIDEMEYYTGIIFKFFSPKLRQPLGGGGRYDTLMNEFGLDIPAVGFSFSMERLRELV